METKYNLDKSELLRDFQSSPMSITSSSMSSTNSLLSPSPSSSSSLSPSFNICMNVKRRTSEPVISQFRSKAEPYFDASAMSDDLNSSNNNPNQHNNSVNESEFNQLNQAKPTNRFFPDGVLDILNKWFYENQNYPYPDENMTNILAKDANISAKQVRKWFANKRVRSNKCYKQTFRSKKDLAAAKSASRRQTKSVSDAEALAATSNVDKAVYFENEEFDDCSHHRTSHTHNNHPYAQTSSSSSSSSSPSSHRFASSSPINSKCETTAQTFRTNYYPLDLGTQHTGHSNFYQNDDKNMHIQDRLNADTSLLTNGNNNNNSNFGYLYSPYLFMNFLQNPSIALHAVMANRFLTMNSLSNELALQNIQSQPAEHANESSAQCQGVSPSLNTSIDYSNATVSSSSSASFSLSGSKAIQKRKTHLSNRFLNESSALNESGTGCSHTLGLIMQSQQNNANGLISADSNHLMRNSISMEEMTRFTGALHTDTPAACELQASKPMRKHKINFGDISDLIN